MCFCFKKEADTAPVKKQEYHAIDSDRRTFMVKVTPSPKFYSPRTVDVTNCGSLDLSGYTSHSIRDVMIEDTRTGLCERCNIVPSRSIGHGDVCDSMCRIFSDCWKNATELCSPMRRSANIAIIGEESKLWIIENEDLESAIVSIPCETCRTLISTDSFYIAKLCSKDITAIHIPGLIKASKPKNHERRHSIRTESRHLDKHLPILMTEDNADVRTSFVVIPMGIMMIVPY